MLYDNAQLLAVYARAHADTDASDLADTARGIAGYMLRDLRLPGGAFACGEDADSEGEEGRFASGRRGMRRRPWTATGESSRARARVPGPGGDKS